VEVAFSLIERVRTNHPEVPIGLLVYANLVVSPGVDTFYARAAKAGVDSILVADVPSFEMTPFSESARRASVAPIMIAPPNSDDGLIAEIAAMSDAYVYVVSRAGVTGITDDISWTQADLIAKLGKACAPPALIGFGIRSPADVRAAIAQGAAGAISGSAGISLVASSSDTGDLCGSLHAWCQAMADAAHGG
jgi:tryptophan synthase alpha chain